MYFNHFPAPPPAQSVNPGSELQEIKLQKIIGN